MSLKRSGMDQPAKLYATNTPFSALTLGGGAGLAVYAKFVKGYNVLWFGAAFVPFLGVKLYNSVKQPTQHLQNCYAYLL